MYRKSNLSLGAEVESRTQGSRPRTQKNFEAKDKPSRGQGPRTQVRVVSKTKEGLEKNFSSDLQKKGLQKFFSGKKDFFWAISA